METGWCPARHTGSFYLGQSIPSTGMEFEALGMVPPSLPSEGRENWEEVGLMFDMHNEFKLYLIPRD